MDVALDTLISVGKFAWMVLVLPLVWLLRELNSIKATQAQVKRDVTDDVEAKLAERARVQGQMLDRLAKIEAALEHGPTKSEIHGLALSVAELTGEFKALSASVSGMQQTVSRVDNYLMENGGK